MNIFDIGSNIGFYSIFLKKKTDGKLLAIEPSLENLNLCRENLKLNNIALKKVSFLNAAASNSNSKKTFYISSQSNLHTLNPEGSAKKYLIGENRSFANYSFYMGATNNNLDQVLKIDKNRVCGVKIFMGSSTGNMLVDNEKALRDVFKNCETSWGKTRNCFK